MAVPSSARSTPSQRRASIRDVARAAGVSHTTVSMILNGKLHAAPETRERVLTAARQLGYQPDPHFRKAVAERQRRGNGEAERRRKTKLLALILREEIQTEMQMNDGYYSSVFSGVSRAASEAGWHILLCPQKVNPTGIPELVHDQKVDGLLVEGPFPDAWLALLATQLPCAFINQLHRSFDAIFSTPDWEKAGYELAKYAWTLGHRHFVFFRHDSPSENLIHVHRGEMGALEALGGTVVHPSLSRPWHPAPENTAEVMDAFVAEWLAADPRPTVILTSDYYGSQITEALMRRGLSVPDDVSIIGRENRIYGQLNRPPLTTYAYPVRQIGYAATQMLIQCLESGTFTPAHIMFQGSLIERASVKRLPP